MKPIVLEHIQTGRIVLFNGKEVILSKILIGKMYPKGNGEEIISQLSQIYTDRHFMSYVTKFTKREYGIAENENKTTDKYSIDNLFTKRMLDFTSLDYEKWFGTNWLYLKNLGKGPVKLRFRDNEEVLLHINETIASCNGKVKPYPLTSILKTQDTINPILLIEKIN